MTQRAEKAVRVSYGVSVSLPVPFLAIQPV